MKHIFLAIVFILTVIICTALGQKTETERSWNQPVEPFKIAGNIYYVGASDVTSYLITTPKGHILLDSGFIETVPLITANIAKLGFKLTDIKAIINSHGHSDHAGGIAELKRLTKAKLYLSEAEAKRFASGGKDDPNYGDEYDFEPATADKIFADGWKLKLGGTTMTAMVTPGHTKGCTTWTTSVNDGGKKLNVIFVCSTSAPGYKLVGNEKYPNIVTDYENTFRRMKALKVDIFLSSHASAYSMAEKAEKLRKGAAVNPFIDPAGYLEYIEDTESAFRKALDAQKAKGN